MTDEIIENEIVEGIEANILDPLPDPIPKSIVGKYPNAVKFASIEAEEINRQAEFDKAAKAGAILI